MLNKKKESLALYQSAYRHFVATQNPIPSGFITKITSICSHIDTIQKIPNDLNMTEQVNAEAKVVYDNIISSVPNLFEVGGDVTKGDYGALGVDELADIDARLKMFFKSIDWKPDDSQHEPYKIPWDSYGCEDTTDNINFRKLLYLSNMIDGKQKRITTKMLEPVIDDMEVYNDSNSEFKDYSLYTLACAPRFGKTLIAITYALYLCHKYPDFRVVLVAGFSAKNELIRDISRRSLKIANSEEFKAINPVKYSRINEIEFVNGSSILFSHVGGDITGQGFNLLLLDDTYKNEKEANEADKKKLLESFIETSFSTRATSYLGLLPKFLITTTLWSNADAVAFIKNNPPLGMKCKSVYIPCIDVENKTSNNHFYTYDQYMRMKDNSFRQHGTDYWWNLHYMCNPDTAQGREFNYPLVRMLTPIDAHTKNYMAIDLSEGNSKDYTGIIVYYKSPADEFVIIDSAKVKMVQDEVIQKIAYMARLHKVNTIISENDFMWRNGYRASLVQKLAKDRTNTAVDEISSNTDRFVKIASLKTYWNTGRVKINMQMNKIDMDNLYNEVQGFPDASNDDLPLALSVASRYVLQADKALAIPDERYNIGGVVLTRTQLLNEDVEKGRAGLGKKSPYHWWP